MVFMSDWIYLSNFVRFFLAPDTVLESNTAVVTLSPCNFYVIEIYQLCIIIMKVSWPQTQIFFVA